VIGKHNGPPLVKVALGDEPGTGLEVEPALGLEDEPVLGLDDVRATGLDDDPATGDCEPTELKSFGAVPVVVPLPPHPTTIAASATSPEMPNRRDVALTMLKVPLDPRPHPIPRHLLDFVNYIIDNKHGVRWMLGGVC
jgi:hypothetical protein